MNDGLPPDVAEALAGVGRFLGMVDGRPSVAGVSVDSEPVRDEVVAAVARALYVGWYLGLPDGGVSTSSPDILPLLRAAHAEASLFEPGWIVVSAGADGRCQVGRGDVWRSLWPGDYYSPVRPGVPPAPGEMVAATLRFDWPDEQTGFWYTQKPPTGPTRPIARAYLHPRVDAIAPVVHALTAALAATAIPYTMKCPLRPEAYERSDTLVLYHARPDGARLEPLLRDLYPSLVPYLDPRTPPLTRRAAPGLAFADDPGGHASFGESRCRALAPAAIELARSPGSDVVAALGAGLAAAGLDPRRPWESPA